MIASRAERSGLSLPASRFGVKVAFSSAATTVSEDSVERYRT
jgi:hypothetical protein